MPDALKRFDISLFTPSGRSRWARTVMEAMASGLLVIGADVGGQSEMLEHERNSLTYPAGDARALAARIVAIANDPLKQEELARAGQRTVRERFTKTRMAGDVESYLSQLAGAA